MKQELIDDVQKENEKLLTQILTDVTNFLINSGVLRNIENLKITKEEKVLLNYYRNSSEQDKTAIFNMI